MFQEPFIVRYHQGIPRARRRVLLGAILTFALVTTGLMIASPSSTPPAVAGPADNFSLTKADNVGGQALIGEHVTYTLTATGDHASGAFLYNLSFRDVLPVGTEFVESTPAPTAILVDVPNPGETTVIWENVSDLPANSVSNLSYTVDTNPDFAGGTTGSTTLPVGATATNNAEAAASLDAGLIPDWSATTGLFTGDVDGSATTSSTMTIVPFRAELIAPAELLRGVHAAGFGGGTGTEGQTYQIQIESNPDYPIDAVTVLDVLSPNLEFLGCEDYTAANYGVGTDNSTDVPLRESTAAAFEEYAGSGRLAIEPAGNADCLEPDSITTVDAGLGDGRANTEIAWTIGNMATGATEIIAYRAGSPMRANTTTWTGATPGTADLAQGRNLDNNNGPATNETDAAPGVDPELLTDGASPGTTTITVDGTYSPTGAPETVTDATTTELEDLIITKSMSGSLVQGTTVVTNLTVSTSEYRDFTDLVVRDLLPSSLCYLGTFVTDETAPPSDWNTTDCTGSTTPATIAGSPVAAHSVRELTDGGPYGTGRMELVFDGADPANAGLAALASDSSVTVSFTSLVREFYRGGFTSLVAEPVLAGDQATNHAEVSGPDVVAAAHTNDGGIDTEAAGGADGDTAEAQLTNSLPTLDKQIAAKAGPLADGVVPAVTASTCASDYGTITWQQTGEEQDNDPTVTGYGPGDIVCYRLATSFAAGLSYEQVKIQDILPPGYSYVAGSAARIAAEDTLPGTTFDPATLSFTPLGSGDIDNPAYEFVWVIAAELDDPGGEVEALDISANHMKMTHNNNSGLVYQLRDNTTAEWSEPIVEIGKGVESVDSVDDAIDVGPNGPDADGSTGGTPPTSVEIQALATVDFRLDVFNSGNKDAINAEVWDELPLEFGCAAFVTATPTATCVGDGPGGSADYLQWTGLPTVTQGTSLGSAPVQIAYTLTVPDTVGPASSYLNVAGVRSYQAPTNTGATPTYFPASNIDPAVVTPNSPEAHDEALLAITPNADVTKTQQSGIAAPGNTTNSPADSTSDHLTIGEIVQYNLIVDIPEGSSVYDMVVTDTLPSGVVYFEGSGLFDGSVSALAPSVTSSETDANGTALDSGTLSVPSSGSNGTISYTLPPTYQNEAGDGTDTVTITFYAQVDDDAANVARPSQRVNRNSADLDWDDSFGAAQPTVGTGNVNGRVVEPALDIAKTTVVPAGNDTAPGQQLTYQLTLTNPSTAGDVSTAYDITIVDTVPLGATPLGVGLAPVTSNGDDVPSTGSPGGALNGVWSEDDRTITWTVTEWSELDALDRDEQLDLTYFVEVDNPSIASGSITNSVDADSWSLPASDPNQTDGRTYTDNAIKTLSLPDASIVKDIEPLGDPATDTATFRVGEPIDYDLTFTVPEGTILFDLTGFDPLAADLEFDGFGTPTVSPDCEVIDNAGAFTGNPYLVSHIDLFLSASSTPTFFIGDIGANGGDCTIVVPYTAHVSESATDSDTVVNSGFIRWNVTDEILDDDPTADITGYETISSPGWDTGAGPSIESFTVVEPQLAIDKDVVALTGPSLQPPCDATPGNNSTGSDDTDDDGSATAGCDTEAGAAHRYTLTISSSGSIPAHDITVVDTVPVGLIPLDGPGGSAVADGGTVTGFSGSIGTWSLGARTITWTLVGPLAPAASSTVDYDATLAASATLSDGDDLANDADIETYYAYTSAERTAITSANPANDDIEASGNGPGATRGGLLPDVVVTEVNFPTLTIDKTAIDDSTDARFDAPFTWQLTVTNTDDVASAFEIDITDDLPAGFTYDLTSARVDSDYHTNAAIEPVCTADGSGSCGVAAEANTETLTWTALLSGPTEPLLPGATITITLDATPQSAALASSEAVGIANTGAANPHTNTASVTGEDTTGATGNADGPYGDSTTDDVVVRRADIEVTKTLLDALPVYYGDLVTYRIQVTNAGPDVATGVAISDVLDPDLTFVAVDAISQGTFVAGVWDLTPTGGDTLAIGTQTLDLQVSVDTADPVTNTAELDASDQWDPDSTPNNANGAEDDLDAVSIDPLDTSLGNRLWYDIDGNDDEDAGEPGLPGVTVAVSWSDADGVDHVETTVTDADGNWAIAGLPTTHALTVTVDPGDLVDPAGTGGLGGTIPAQMVPTFELDDAPNPALSRAANGHTSGLDYEVDGVVLTSATPSYLDVDFAFQGINSLGDLIWFDVDGSGTATPDAGEPPLVGVTVQATWAGWDGMIDDDPGTLGIDESADNVVYLDVTDAAGDYGFTSLPDGRYRVDVIPATLPHGIDDPTYDVNGVATAHTSSEFTLGAAIVIDDRDDLDFSYRSTSVGSIGDTVWLDVDGDGTIDGDEPGISGVTITATWANPDGADVTYTTTTAADGSYAFDDLPYGDFTVTVDDTTLPGGLNQTHDLDGTGTAHSSAVTISAGTPTELDADFGYQGTGSIGQVIWWDIDGDGTNTVDPGDVPLEGATVTVTWIDNGTPYERTFVTDDTGTYLATGLPHGDYTVDVTPPGGGFVSSWDPDGGADEISALTLGVGTEINLDQNFSYVGPGSIGDTVWYDYNADINQLGGEVGLPGVDLDVTWHGPDGVAGNGDDVTITVTTDANGNYLADNLPLGSYDVTVDPATLPDGMVQTYDADGTGTAHTAAVTLGVGTEDTDIVDFGYTGTGSIGDLVWLDLNGDATATADPAAGGVPAEPPIAGVEVTVTYTNPGGTPFSITATTDTNGLYTVGSLPLGDHTVTLTSTPVGLSPSYELDATPDNAVAVSLSTTTPDLDTVDFSLRGTGTLGDTVWYDADDSGDADPVGSGVFVGADQAIPNVDVDIVWYGFDGTSGTSDDLAFTETTDINGEWGLSNLPPGTYEAAVDPATLPTGIDDLTFQREFGASGDPADLTGTTTVSLGAGATIDDVDFSYTGEASVGDTVWYDRDGDGIQDLDEVALGGVVVELVYAGPIGPVVLTDITDNTGHYEFTDVPIGIPLVVSVDPTSLPDGITNPTHDLDDPADGSSAAGSPHATEVTLSAIDPFEFDADFGYRGPGTVGDTVFFDADASGESTPQVGDIGLPNVEVTLTWTNPTSGPDMTVTTTTDADGRYLFEHLPSAAVTVTLNPSTLPTNAAAVHDPEADADLESTVTIPNDPGDGSTPFIILDRDFSFTGASVLGDTVWHDRDGDGIQDPGEPGLDGALVTATWVDPITGATYTWTTSTAGGGMYFFGNLPDGDYTVTVDPSPVEPGFGATHDLDDPAGGSSVPDGVAELSLSNEVRDDVDFGFRRLADLGITKTHSGDLVIGAQATFTITVTNNGPAQAEEPIQVTDTLPPGLTPVSATGTGWSCSISGQDVSCSLVDSGGLPTGLAIGASAAIAVVVDVHATAAPGVTNVATVTHPTNDPDPSNNAASDDAAVPLAILSIDKTLNGELRAGEDAFYALTVTNLGPSASTGEIIVTDELPTGLAFTAASTPAGVTCTAADQLVTCGTENSLAVNESFVVVLTTRVAAAAGVPIVNEATVSGGNEVNGTPIDPVVLDAVIEQAQTDTALASVLGLNASPQVVDLVAETTVGGSLALTGTNLVLAWLTLAMMLLLSGVYVRGLGRRRESQLDTA